MTALRGWCTSPSATANPPFQSRQAQLESGVRGNVPAPFGAGERLRSPTYRYPYDKDRPAIIAWVSRQGAVVLQATRDFTVQTVQKGADLTVQTGSRLYTDSASSY
jgi:hypothetical protein